MTNIYKSLPCILLVASVLSSCASLTTGDEQIISITTDCKARKMPTACVASNGTETVRRIENIPAEQKAYYAQIFHGFLDRGVYFAPSGYEVGFLSTAHTDSDLNLVLETAKSVFQNVKV
jgi:glutamate-1-semialdehyde aminotransferase